MTTTSPRITTSEPLPSLEAIAKAGVTGAHLRSEFGGRGLDVRGTIALLEELGRSGTDAGHSFSAVTTMASTGVALQDFGVPEQQARWLPGIAAGTLIGAHAITEDGFGSDALNMVTRAVPQGAGWVISGSKTFVTNGGIADVYVVYARTSNKPGPLGLTAFLIPADTPGLVIGHRLETMGLKSSPVTSLSLESCEVSPAQVIGRVGGGFLVLDHVMQREILFSFSVNVGEMERRLSRCVEWARTRHQFGRSIGSNQAIAHLIADMRIDVDTARLWLQRAAAAVDSGRSATMEVAAAKVVASTANQKTARDAMQIFGGRGYLTEYGLEAGVRDSMAGSIYSGTNEIQRTRIASSMGVR